MKKVISIIALAICAGLTLVVLNYVLATRGEPYSVATVALASNEDLDNRVGGVRSIRLYPWGTYRERTAGPSGEAWIEVEVIGRSRREIVKLEMVRKEGHWNVRSATTRGGPLKLGEQKSEEATPKGSWME